MTVVPLDLIVGVRGNLAEHLPCIRQVWHGEELRASRTVQAVGSLVYAVLSPVIRVQLVGYQLPREDLLHLELLQRGQIPDLGRSRRLMRNSRFGSRRRHPGPETCAVEGIRTERPDPEDPARRFAPPRPATPGK